ncbi:pteridine reductase [Pseudomonas citronellolis]|uniref:pteridine reductase n=1 Tax=Pseudomonas citronellolis TaxID=53408 RepID=UPI0021BF875E|nr:pteridine reductase [Pseudomonas citronellolis]UXJ50183.1 pteridine reductase [Pseudomonas citronellolis]
MSSCNLEGKAYLVTGGARRIGAQIVKELHSAGANVVVHYRNSAEEALDLSRSLEWERHGSIATVQSDLLDDAQFKALVETASQAFGRLDGLINNASSFYPTRLGTMTSADWDDIVGVNFKAPLFLAQTAWPHLRESHGAIVNIVDINAERPLSGFSIYCAAKAGLLSLTRALALEMAPYVRVNGIAPGLIEWPSSNMFNERERIRMIESTPLERIGTPAEVARAVLFLLADASYISGQILAVDGGRSARL